MSEPPERIWRWRSREGIYYESKPDHLTTDEYIRADVFDRIVADVFERIHVPKHLIPELVRNAVLDEVIAKLSKDTTVKNLFKPHVIEMLQQMKTDPRIERGAE